MFASVCHAHTGLHTELYTGLYTAAHGAAHRAAHRDGAVHISAHSYIRNCTQSCTQSYIGSCTQTCTQTCTQSCTQSCHTKSANEQVGHENHGPCFSQNQPFGHCKSNLGVPYCMLGIRPHTLNISLKSVTCNSPENISTLDD